MNFSTFIKNGFFSLSVYVFFSLLSISCAKKTNQSDNVVIFDTIQESKSQSIDYKKSKLNCNLHIAFTYPVSYEKSAQLGDLQKLFIGKVFPPQYANLSPKEAVKNFTANYISDFQSIQLKDYFGEDYILEDENNFIYELNLEDEIVYNRNNFISFVVKNTNYEGGAHGSYSVNGYVIDLNTGKLLTEDDFAGNNYKKNLAPLIVQKIVAAKGLGSASELEEIGYNAIEDIVPNENFTINDKGITYYYNEYEIAAYFVGTTEVFIPYEELKAYITDDSPISLLAGM